MYFDDKKRHYKPHFHAVYAEYDASIGVDGILFDGKLPHRQMKLVEAWVLLHEDELYEAWYKAVRKEDLGKIEPLR